MGLGADDVRFGDVEASAADQRRRDEILSILVSAHGRWPSFDLEVPRSAHLRWKLEGAPGLPSLIAQTEMGGRLVGVTVRLRRRFLVEGTERRAFDGVDTAILPEFQGQGLYARGAVAEDATAAESESRLQHRLRSQ